MIHVPVTLSVAVAKPITSKKDGKKYVALEGMIFGLGIFKILLPENKVPDQLEGKTCNATFAVTIGQDLRPSLRFVGFDGFVGEVENGAL